MRTGAAGALPRSGRRSHFRRSQRRWGIIFLTPALVLYSAFVLYPLVATVAWSFSEWAGTLRTGRNGWFNYQLVFQQYPFNEQLSAGAWHNLLFFGYTMVFQNGLGLLLAVLLQRTRRSRLVLQALIGLPYMVSPLVIGSLWSLLLNPLFGPVKGLLDAVGLGSWYSPWLGDPGTSLVTVAVINAWQSMAVPMLIFFAALSGIPSEINEAAACDGANNWQTFRQITLPLLLPAILTVTLLTFIWSFGVFDVVYAIGGPTGSPGGSLDVLALLFYRAAFTGGTNALGVGSALATMLFVGLAVVVGILSKMRRSLESRWD